MKTTHPYYGIKINTESKKTQKIFEDLNKHYDRLPSTKCLNCPTKCGVEADCCKVFSPPMLLVEFLQAMTKIEKWPEEQQVDLLYSCLESFLNPDRVKPCILLENVLCSIYDARPLSCRLFGIYEDSEYKERLKKFFGDQPPENTPFIKQCKNLEVDGKENFVSKTKSDAIFFFIHKLDISLFEDKRVGEEVVMSSCTYMPFDAHYLCLMFGPDYLDDLTKIKLDLRKVKDNYEKDTTNKENKSLFIKKEEEVKDLLIQIKNSLGTKGTLGTATNE